MHVFSFIPDRLLLSRKCCELIHYTGGSCLLSLPLYYFSSTIPTVPIPVHGEQPYSQLPICTLLFGGLPADKWPGGEVQGESCQRQSALCCCSNPGKRRQRRARTEPRMGDAHKIDLTKPQTLSSSVPGTDAQSVYVKARRC